MKRNDTNREWESFAQADPYWAVLSSDQYRHDNLSPERLEQFFLTGREHIATVLGRLRKYFNFPASFDTTVDFGCGVGRLLIPISAHTRKAIGVDVSATMLDLCRKHAAEQGVGNLELHQTEDILTTLANYRGTIDLVTSFIVFQHIPPHIGNHAFDALLQLLRPGGVGYLHFTYAEGIENIRHEQSNTTGILHRYYQRTHEGLMKLVEYPAGDSHIQMNHYNLNELMARFHLQGIPEVVSRLTPHAQTLGIEFYFQKP